MTYDMIMIHFGELSTKGNNRRLFVSQLLHNVRVALKKFEGVYALGARDHIYVELNGADADEVIKRLQQVSGIQRLSLVAKVSKDFEEIAAAVIELIKQESGHTFKIKAHRVDKTYPLDSMQLSAKLGGEVLKSKLGLEVDVHNPDIVMNVNLREEYTYIWCHDYLGIGGYPLGMNGKVTMLLSGGIDSPVAAYALIRRGIKVECLHFASPPYTQMAVIDKLKDLLKDLNDYQPSFKLNIIPFTKLQEAIYAHVSEPYCITIMRRMPRLIRIGSSLHPLIQIRVLETVPCEFTCFLPRGDAEIPHRTARRNARHLVMKHPPHVIKRYAARSLYARRPEAVADLHISQGKYT